MAGMIYLDDGEPFCATFPEFNKVAPAEARALWSVTRLERDPTALPTPPIRFFDRSEPGDPLRRFQLVDETGAIFLIGWLTRNRPEHLVGI